MTPSETLKALKLAGKPIVRSHFYRLVTKLRIKPIGHSRPKHYPPDTASRILNHMGVMPDDEYQGYVQDCMAGHAKIYAKPARPAKLISVRALRAAKPQRKGTK